MSDMPQTPTTTTGVIAYLNLEGAAAASDFYQRAFGAQELFRLPAEDGKRLMHCHLKINGADVMISDCFPEMGGDEFRFQPTSSITLHLQVTDIDAWVKRAVEAGAKVTMPVELMFWGDRYGKILDPFQINWSLGETPKK
jgi:PhnB protein